MAAGYAAGARLVRGDRVVEDIAAYFEALPERLAGRAVLFDEVTPTVDGAIVTWRVGEVTGTDRYVVRDGRIVEQHVTLHSGDF